MVNVDPTVTSEIWPKQSAAGPQASSGPVALTSLMVTGVPSGVSGMSADVDIGLVFVTPPPVSVVTSSPAGSTYCEIRLGDGGITVVVVLRVTLTLHGW